jgi:hypothetical protein
MLCIVSPGTMSCGLAPFGDRYSYNSCQIGICREKSVQDEASYVCEACGEEIVVPIDFSAGESQEYVEDCPVCCRPNLVHVEIEEEGRVRAWAEKESG